MIDDHATIVRQAHEMSYIARGDVRLTDDEMDEAIQCRREIHQLVEHAAAQQRISEYIASRLNRAHAYQSALLHRIKERACILVVDIALDQDFKVVKAGGVNEKMSTLF